MRADSAAWERAVEVRGAAAGWRRAGFIDEPAERAVQEAFPDPCVTPSPVWRVLTAGVVAAVVLCALAACVAGFGQSASVGQVLLFLFALACFVTTESLEASPRFARRGAAGATAVLGVGFLLVGFALFLSETLHLRLDDVIDGLLIAAVIACGTAWWRWGSPLFAALAALSLFLLLGRLPHGRLLWLLVGAAFVALAARRLDAAAWAPSHRLGAAVLVVAGIVAAYAAVNVYSFDEHLLEKLARFTPDRATPARPLLVLSAIGTAALPLAVLTWGIRSRRTLLLDTGIVLTALSLVTLRHYVHLAPLWTVLIVAGVVLVLAALAVERALRRAPRHEIAGFTAEPLFSDERRQHALQIVPVIAAFTPAAAAAERPGFAGEGGRFGGGGASEKF